jgi:hypothetical protein
VPIGETELRATMSDFVEPGPLDAVLRAVVGGEACVLNWTKAPAEKVIVVLAVQCDDEASAVKAYDLLLASSKGKDEKLKEGQIRIIDAGYAKLKSDTLGKCTLITKKLKVGEETVGMRELAAHAGPFVIDVLFSGVEVEEKELLAIAEKIAAFVKKSHSSEGRRRRRELDGRADSGSLQCPSQHGAGCSRALRLRRIGVGAQSQEGGPSAARAKARWRWRGPSHRDCMWGAA